MIQDKLCNIAHYVACNPRFQAAFEWLNAQDLLNMPAGKYEILPNKECFANVLDFEGKPEEKCRMETHNDYLDIQIPLGDSEEMGWKATADLQEVTTPYNPEKDVTFFADAATSRLHLCAGEFAIFFPWDGHQPGIAPGKQYRKIIVKVKI